MVAVEEIYKDFKLASKELLDKEVDQIRKDWGLTGTCIITAQESVINEEDYKECFPIRGYLFLDD